MHTRILLVGAIYSCLLHDRYTTPLGCKAMSVQYDNTKIPNPSGFGIDWLGYKDSNLNYLSQNQAYYRYTIPHCVCGADEEIRTLTRSPSLRPERSASASSATSARATTPCNIHDCTGVCQSEDCICPYGIYRTWAHGVFARSPLKMHHTKTLGNV